MPGLISSLVVERRAAAAVIATGVLLLASTTLAEPCFEAIREDGARRVYDALAAAKPSDGCTLENVATQKVQMRIDWAKDGKKLAPVFVIPSACAPKKDEPGKVSVLIPESLRSACPRAAELTRRTVEGGSLGDLVTMQEGLPVDLSAATDSGPVASRPGLKRPLVLGGAAFAVLVAGLAGFGIVRRRRRAAASAGGTSEPSSARPKGAEPSSATETSHTETSNPGAPRSETSGSEGDASEPPKASPDGEPPDA